MDKQIYSFSTKNKDDTEFVNKLKIRAMQSGRSFSHIVIQALREQYEPNAKAEKTQEAK